MIEPTIIAGIGSALIGVTVTALIALIVYRFSNSSTELVQDTRQEGASTNDVAAEAWQREFDDVKSGQDSILTALTNHVSHQTDVMNDMLVELRVIARLLGHEGQK